MRASWGLIKLQSWPNIHYCYVHSSVCRPPQRAAQYSESRFTDEQPTRCSLIRSCRQHVHVHVHYITRKRMTLRKPQITNNRNRRRHQEDRIGSLEPSVQTSERVIWWVMAADRVYCHLCVCPGARRKMFWCYKNTTAQQEFYRGVDKHIVRVYYSIV